MQIFIYRQDGNLGPYSLEELRAQLTAGAIRPDDLAWQEGLPQWEPLSKLLPPAFPPLPVFGTALPSSTSSRVPSPSKAQAKSFFHQAATCSVWILLFPIVVQIVEVPAIQASTSIGDPHGATWIRLFFSVVIGLAMLTGLVLGIVALFGISKYGTKGILVKSLFGIIVPLVLILLSIPVVMSTQKLAAQLRAMHEASSAPGN